MQVNVMSTNVAGTVWWPQRNCAGQRRRPRGGASPRCGRTGSSIWQCYTGKVRKIGLGRAGGAFSTGMRCWRVLCLTFVLQSFYNSLTLASTWSCFIAPTIGSATESYSKFSALNNTMIGTMTILRTFKEHRANKQLLELMKRSWFSFRLQRRRWESREPPTREFNGYFPRRIC